MKHMNNLYPLCKNEIKQWKQDPYGLVFGIGLGAVVAWLFYNHVIFLLLLSPLIFPWMMWRRNTRIVRRRAELRKEFKEMMLSVSNSLSAGYSFENAMKVAAGEQKEDSQLGPHLQQFLVELQVNEPIEVALETLAKDLDVEEITQFCQIVTLVKKNGGNLIEIIGKTVDQISESIQLKEEIVTMTAAKQMEKQIMSVMPFLILAYVRISNPGYFDVLYTSIPGRLLATAAFVALIGANYWAERVVMIEI